MRRVGSNVLEAQLAAEATVTDNLVCVTTFHYRHEAELARGALEASGIDATIMADDMGSEIPSMDLHQGVALFVREEDLARARETLQLEG